MGRVLRLAVCVWAVACVARAESLSVGPGQRFATPCAAVARANPQDVIEIAAGTYTDSCALNVEGLTLRGIGGRPTIDLSGTDHPAQYKAIYVISAPDVTVENLELTGAHVSDANGANAAALRIEAGGLRVLSCDIHDNQNGILGGSSGSVTIEHSVFYNNGLGDGCNGAGCTHNVYIGEVDALYFRFNWSHHVATDTDDKGHLLKSRAKQNFVLYNRLTGEDGYDSYEIDLPNGGLAVIVGNVVQKGKRSGNGTSVTWGEEGVKHPDARVFLINNTIVSALSSGRFMYAKGAELTLQNNLFVGQGVMAPADLPASNLLVDDAHFVDAAQHDYRLAADSPARGRAAEVAAVADLPLRPAFEYVHPAGDRARPSVRDVGAFEYVAAAGSEPDERDAGVADHDKMDAAVSIAGAGGSVNAGAGAGAAGETAAGRPGSSPAAEAGASASGETDAVGDGCGCYAVGAPYRGGGGELSVLCVVAAVLWLCRRRRCRD